MRSAASSWHRGQNPSKFHPLLAFTTLVVASCAHAAPPSPIHWQAASPSRSVKPGAKFDLTLHATIDPGWHLYALTEPEDGPLPTEINLTDGDPADLLRADQSHPRTTQDSVFGKPVTLFESTATFILHLQLARTLQPGSHPLHLLIRYQSCNDHVCLPPHTDVVEAPLTTN